jgi:hypothetical protein
MHLHPVPQAERAFLSGPRPFFDSISPSPCQREFGQERDLESLVFSGDLDLNWLGKVTLIPARRGIHSGDCIVIGSVRRGRLVDIGDRDSGCVIETNIAPLRMKASMHEIT